MNRKCCGFAIMAAALLFSTPAAAQDPPITLTPVTPHTWDISGDIGWFKSRRAEAAPSWDQWYDVPAASASVGRYWTPHVRTDVRVSVSGEGRTYQQDQIPLPGQPFPVFRVREHYFQTASAGLGVSYQFFENQWFHPFVDAGVDVERETRRTEVPEQQFPFSRSEPPLLVPAGTASTHVAWAARPFVGTGFKWYVNERGFIKSDLKFSFGPDRFLHTTWSAGIGVDL